MHARSMGLAVVVATILTFGVARRLPRGGARH